MRLDLLKDDSEKDKQLKELEDKQNEAKAQSKKNLAKRENDYFIREHEKENKAYNKPAFVPDFDEDD